MEFFPSFFLLRLSLSFSFSCTLTHTKQTITNKKIQGRRLEDWRQRRSAQAPLRDPRRDAALAAGGSAESRRRRPDRARRPARHRHRGRGGRGGRVRAGGGVRVGEEVKGRKDGECGGKRRGGLCWALFFVLRWSAALCWKRSLVLFTGHLFLLSLMRDLVFAPVL